MANSVEPLAGGNFGAVATVADLTQAGLTKQPPISIGTTVNGNDGKTYVYGKANATITAATAVCAVNASTFLVAATGGAYLSPPVAMATGDYGWFSKALV